MDLLKNISLSLPTTDSLLQAQLLTFFEPFGSRKQDTIIFSKSQNAFLPTIKLVFNDTSQVFTTFQTSATEIKVPIISSTGQKRQSSHMYSPIDAFDCIQRIKDMTILGIDHIGFDLPWFDDMIHPEMQHLRDALNSTCLYHTFPTGEPWDFIIPGTSKEITGTEKIDYTKERRPKFEIVTLDKTSTPLIQFDILVEASYETLKGLFPEAIHVPELKNMWVYIKNNYGIDLCFVLNEHHTGDWSNFFAHSRLQ